MDRELPDAAAYAPDWRSDTAYESVRQIEIHSVD